MLNAHCLLAPAQVLSVPTGQGGWGRCIRCGLIDGVWRPKAIILRLGKSSGQVLGGFESPPETLRVGSCWHFSSVNGLSARHISRI